MNFDYKKMDNDYIAGTYGRYDVCIDHGKNATCFDIDGKEYIDFTSGIGVNSLGFCDDGWNNAVTNQLGKLQHMSNLYYTEPNIKLAEILCKQTKYSKVFFANSGAEANEGAIKIARKKSFDKYGKGRSNIITLVNSFHGRTITTLSATGQDIMHDFFFPFTEGFIYGEANNTTDVKSKINNTVCAIMLEFVQGEGGVIPLEQDFVEQVFALAKQHDLTIIADEVQTGIGRTGKLLAAEHYGVKPDITTLAKGLGNGLPIGAILMSKETESVLQKGQHGTTFGGNPIACAGAVEVLSRIDDSFLKEVTEKSEYLKDKLEAITEVLKVEGKGLMMGINLTTKTAAEVAAKCAKQGLLVLTAKEKIRFLPPITISKQEIDKGITIFEKVLEG